MDEKINIKIVNLNNKSRKGLYVYVKAKNKPSRYYKFNNKQGQIDATKNYYIDKYIKKINKKNIDTYNNYKKAYNEKIKGIKPYKRKRVYRQAEQYISKIKKRGSIESNIKKGIKDSVIKDIVTAKTEDITKAKKELLKDLVLDKDLLNLLISNENFNKLKNRMEYRLKAIDKYGNILIRAQAHGKTINQVQQELRKAIKNNKEVSSFKYRFLDYIKKLKWEGCRTREGTIRNVQIQCIFRRG